MGSIMFMWHLQVVAIIYGQNADEDTNFDVVFKYLNIKPAVGRNGGVTPPPPPSYYCAYFSTWFGIKRFMDDENGRGTRSQNVRGTEIS